MKLIGTPAGTRLMIILLFSALAYSSIQLTAADKPKPPSEQVIPLKKQEFKISAQSYNIEKNIAKPKKENNHEEKSSSKGAAESNEADKISNAQDSEHSTNNKKKKTDEKLGGIATSIVRLLGI